ncbi:MAG TPA: ADP-ribosylation factor-like protein [Thermomicrobiales bacterium]|nr:ADP-ribosylation factor-like protein [Thermomicrobiales bacterium]
MALIDIRKREIHAKIVYCGPGLSGKTTNLLNIHGRLPEDIRGEMQSIATADERTLFFDFVPISEIDLGGWAVRFHLYSVPGQDVYVRTRRAILGGADGIVFVADAAGARLDANRSSMTELEGHLGHYQRELDDVPLVVQYNKIDVEDALTPEVLDEELNPGLWPAFPAIAIHGNGVAETLGAISRLVARTL